MKLSKTTIIEAPTSLVFQILQDIDLATTWVPMLTSYRLISEAPNQVGSIYESLIDNKDMQYKQTAKIKTYVENEYIRWEMAGYFHDMEFVIYVGETEYFLKPISEVFTELTFTTEIHYKGLMKILTWFAKSKVKKTSEALIDETFRNFKSLVEMNYWSGEEHP